MKLLLTPRGPLALALVLLACGGTPAAAPQDGRAAVAEERGDAEVASILEDAFGGTEIPGGVGAIARLGEAPRIGSFGVRRAGGDEAFLPGDLVHIGSCTKAMTAVLVARLDEDERLDWDAPLSEAIPALAPGADPAYAGLTLRHLLTHTSGLQANALFWGAHAELPLRERRMKIAAAMLRKAPDPGLGEAFRYSNVGYMIAGCFAEAATETTWEELLLAEVAAPLGMDTLGFGPPSTDGGVDQPWGHSIARGEARPSQRDNAEALGPAGRVHVSIADWSKFVLAFSDAAVEGEDTLISAPMRERLLAPEKDSYACGWMIAERGWGDGQVLWHNGSNTYWYALTWVAPRRGRAYLVAVNAAGGDVRERADRAVGALIQADAARDAREDAAK